jgi:hypothetical protein
MSTVVIARAANAEVEGELFEGNDYTVIINVNGVAPALSEAVITAKVRGSNIFETLLEYGTVDLTDPKAVKIMFPGGSPAELSAIKITPNSTFTDDVGSTIDVLVNVLSVGRPV